MRATFIACYALVLLVTLGLSWLNLGFQQRAGAVVPPELAGVIDPERLQRIAAYTRERARFGMFERAVSGLIFGFALCAGPLGAYDRFIAGVAPGFALQGTAFMLGLSLLGAVFSLPFGFYRTFFVEARHGFNRSSYGLFFRDWLKGTLLSLAFVFVLGYVAFWVVRALPGSWWLWVWLVFVAFSLFVTFAAPFLIEPLFFRMTPLAVEGLADEVRALAERAGVQLGRVLQMDASRRSAHSNAYFTGLGRVKRVVLFDTLLSHMTHREILAVLSHELGHWKKHHVLVRTLFSFALALVFAFAVGKVETAAFVPALVGETALSFPARLVVLATLASLVSFPLTPLGSAWSRHDEWQADRYAVELSNCAPELASALAKLSRENLANLHPHPWYASFYYTHPPVTERIRRLQQLAATQQVTA